MSEPTFSRVLWTVALALANASNAFASTLHVRSDAPPGGNGTSWASAFDSLQTALSAAVSGDRVWVKAGTYRPGPPGGAPTLTFQLKDGVEVYGGFAGNETSLAERDWRANETVLSGDLLQDDQPGFANRNDNVYHVVTAMFISGAKLDGFVVRGGHALGPGGSGGGGGVFGPQAQLRNLTVVDNEAIVGGGIHLQGFGVNGGLVEACVIRGNRAVGGGGLNVKYDHFMVRGCVIADNEATGAGGGGISINGDAYWGGKIQNSLVVGNRALGSGGGILSHGAYLEVSNTTIAGNHGVTGPGGVFQTGSPDILFLWLRNSIVWGNTSDATSNPYLDQVSSTVLVLTSAVEGGAPPLDLDPRWSDPAGPDGLVGTADDDFRLSCTSPYIDRGNNGYAAGISTDLAGAPRFLDDPATPDQGSGSAPIVDLGPYEFGCGCDDATAYCVAVPNSTGVPASISWSGSTSLLADGFTLLVENGVPFESAQFFYGTQTAQTPFGDGVRCVGGALFRTGVFQLDANGAGAHPLDFTLHPAGSGSGQVLPGSTWYFQCIVSDPNGGQAGFNASNALEATFCP
jgi:hypothetical protein